MNLRGHIVAIAAALILLASPGPGPVLAQSPRSGTGEVALRVQQFGLANVARPGDWAGIELEVTDSAAQPRNVLLRIAVRDGDGDTELMRRVIVANPGIKQSAWLYARLPFATGPGSLFRVTAHEALDSGGGAAAASEEQYTTGRLLAALDYPVSNPADAAHGLIGIVGRKTAGLDQYSAVITANNGFAPTGHEYLQIVPGLNPGTTADTASGGSLPDRWMGFMPYEALVWTGAASDEQSLRLSAPQAEAIREWVRRGGHLIIIIPPAGQSWVDIPGNPLSDIVPEVSLARLDGVNLNAYRQLLTRRADVPFPTNAVVHHFVSRPGTERTTAIPILNTPDGNTVVTRRLVGTGAVTLIGLDLTTSALNNTSGALQADLFWHRVLGKRLPLLSMTDFDAERIGDAAATPPRAPRWLGGRTEANLDLSIGALVTKSARAAAGLLLAFVVFLLYWLLAGPVGFYALKERNLKHYSWPAFLAATAVFTAIAWGGANVLRTRRVEGQHLTFVDHVFGQSNQRMRSWFTVLLPTYGEQTVAVGDARDAETWRHALTPWEAGGSGGSGLASFPDARPYEVDARAPWRVRVPARATTKTFQADWAGGLPANWGMITPHAADGASVALGEELRMTEDPEVRSRWKLSGKLTHNLPGALQDVLIIVVGGQSNLPTPRPGRYVYSSGELQARAWAFAFPGNKAWMPGDELDLSAATGSDGGSSRVELGNSPAFWDKFVPRPPPQFGGRSPNDIAQSQIPESMTALALFGVIPPPDSLSSATQTLARRSATHSYDLSRWFTQPCVIVIGHLAADAQGNGIESPLPVSIDGSPVDTIRKHILGRTVVRWVYPLPPMPPRFASPAPVGEQSAEDDALPPEDAPEVPAP